MVTVYTTKTCAYCEMVKKYLTAKGVPFSIVDVDDDRVKGQEIIEKTGAMTVPVTERDGQYVIGFNLPQLASLIA